jgi:hypothetical protein
LIVTEKLAAAFKSKSRFWAANADTAREKKANAQRILAILSETVDRRQLPGV